MARGIVKLKDDCYVEWSSVCDAPLTYVMTEEQMRKYLGDHRESKARLERAKATGTSYFDMSAEDLERYNRAGDKEETLSFEQIINKYGR